MTGDRVVAVIAIVGMLSLVLARLASNRTPRHKLLRMAGLWALIVVVITVAVVALR